MRVFTIFALTLLWTSTASAQQLPAGGCDVIYSRLTPVPGADIKTIIRTEFRRNDGLPVEVRCPDVQVFAQEIDYWPVDERLELRGQVVFQQGGTRITAVTGRVDLKTRTGRFETASGTLQLTDRQIDRTLFGALEPEAFFTAALIEKTGPRTYRLTDATFTTCVQPSRRWQMTSSKLTFTVDRYAVMHNVRLQVKDVSVVYLPLFYYPIQEDDRATGFLMPGYGSSTYRGFTLSNAFFWAINRSADATIYHDWFARSGQGVGADFRYAGHGGSSGDVRAYMINQKAGETSTGTATPASRSYEFRGNLVQNLPAGIRIQGQANYFTDVTTQQLYQTDLNVFTQRSSYVRLDASGTWGRLRTSAQAERNDVYFGTTATSYRTFPRVNLSISDAPIGRTKIYAGGGFDVVNLERLTDVDKPDSAVRMFRTDGRVSVRAPFSLGSALSFTTALSARRTDWSARKDPETGVRIEEPISRQLFEAQVRMVGPVFTRVFNTPGSGWLERVKHIAEPSISVLRRSAFKAFDEVIPLDPAVDYVVGGITQLSYGISNRILARVRQDDGTSVVRQLASLDIHQSYYSDQNAAQYDVLSATSFGGPTSLLPPPGKLGPVRVGLQLSPTSTISGQLNLEYDTKFRAVRSYRASASVRQPVLELSGSWNKQQVIKGLAGYSDPRFAGHSLTVSGRVKKRNGGASLAYSTAIDFLNERFLQHRFGAFYNAQCCGIAIDYSVINQSHYGLRNNKQFSVSFSLAGIGSFVNPLGVFGNNGRQ